MFFEKDNTPSRDFETDAEKKMRRFRRASAVASVFVLSGYVLLLISSVLSSSNDPSPIPLREKNTKITVPKNTFPPLDTKNTIEYSPKNPSVEPDSAKNIIELFPLEE